MPIPMDMFVCRQVRQNIITASGSVSLEFAQELLLVLENDTPRCIEMFYKFHKRGFYSEKQLLNAVLAAFSMFCSDK